MKAKKNWIVTITLLAFVIVFIQVTHVTGKSEQKTNTPQIKFVYLPSDILAGLKGVSVVVERFSPEAVKYGFNELQYKTDVELRLRKKGVNVFTHEERLKVGGQPWLYIKVDPLIYEKDSMEKFNRMAVNIIVELREIVVLERNPSICIIAPTWQKNFTLNYFLNRLDWVRGDVISCIDTFIFDYLAANPKEAEAKTKNNK